MKKYYELTDRQRDRAVEYALQELVKNLVDEVLYITFKKYHLVFEEAISLARKGNSAEAYQLVLLDADLRSELLDIAEMAAEHALYSEATDHVVSGVADENQ